MAAAVTVLVSVPSYPEDANETDVPKLSDGVREQANVEVSLLRQLARQETLDATPTLAPTPQVEVPPVPAATAPPAHVASLCGLGELEALICGVFGEAQGLGDQAIRVARCESGTDGEGQLDGVWAVGAGSYGLFQIQASYHAERFPGFWEHWMEPEFNIMMAWSLYSEQGWSPWACRWAAW